MENPGQLDFKDSDILLVIPPPFWTKMPHLGVAYLSTFLKSKGIKANVYDFNLELHNSAPLELRSYWKIDCLNSLFVTEVSKNICLHFQDKINNFVANFLLTDIPVIGFSVNIISIFIANEISRLIKLRDKNRIIIFGGPATFFKSHRKLLKSCFVDIFVIGEGEATLLNILDNLKKHKKIKTTAGILIGKDYLHDVAPARPIENLDTIPFPTFSEFELNEYNQNDTYKPVPMILSRGCIGRCSYCIDCIMWPKYRYRSAGHIVKEIEYHIDTNKIKGVEFNDLTCNGNIKQLSELCDLIIESKFKFDWVSYAIIRKDMDEGLLLKLKKSGCHTLIYGLESGSDNILKRMRKNYTVKDAERILHLTHEAGICASINIIVGFPGETQEDFNLTADFIYQNKERINEVTNVSGFTLFPEAEIGRFRNKYGVIWQKGTDPMLFYDANGLNLEKRKQRVENLAKILEDIKVNKQIINKAKLNPAVVESIKDEISI